MNSAVSLSAIQLQWNDVPVSLIWMLEELPSRAVSLGSKPTCTILVRRPVSKERLRRSRRVTFIRSSCSHGTRRASFSTVSISAYYKHASEIHIIHSVRVERISYIKLLNIVSFENSLVWRNKQNHLCCSYNRQIFSPTCVLWGIFKAKSLFLLSTTRIWLRDTGIKTTSVLINVHS